ncbi:Aste57867_1872 [Aphanomyces stellatus]|uniref:Aste57867_1872 protein n=1 Tax=Aphanomyces stellatus TaxID=120398 RepID=A0A485K655_9STRA|nr:hypothetical protein As57867_001870 [Aphanomyces stellatus]VFT79079.1 Aste57867_1872 [Aphanomyces stellatus]
MWAARRRASAVLRRHAATASRLVPARFLYVESSSTYQPKSGGAHPWFAALALAGVGVAHCDGAAADNDDEAAAYVNWSATHVCHPTRVYEPTSVAEVESIVALHHLQQSKLRCMGSGVSPNGLGFSNDSILTLSRLDRILDVDVAANQVTVQGGVVVGDLLAHLREHGLTLQNVASIREQTIAGVTQAGCHGTGAMIPPMEEQIVAMEIVTPAAGRLTLHDPADMRFQLAKCGLGALGVVTQLTLQCVPMHRLVETTQLVSLAQLRTIHSTLLQTYQHVRYMWLPYTDQVVVVTSHPEDDDATPTHAAVSTDMDFRLAPLRRLYMDLVKTFPTGFRTWRFTQLRDALYALDPLNAAHIARVTQAEVIYWQRSQGTRVAFSDDIVGFDCGGQQLVSEVAFPMQGSPTTDLDFMEALLARIAADGLPAHTPIEQRWTAASRAALSPAQSQDPTECFSWVGIILYLDSEDAAARRAIEAAFVAYSRMLEDVMAPFGATEHWAKLELGNRDAAEVAAVRARLEARFPAWTSFVKLRNEWDPHHVLSNEFVDALTS